jgi:adenylyltransferase/sulfurtransferase
MGGLGSPVAVYLACAGIGHLTYIDSDSVELSNLNRQILHLEKDIGKQKVISATTKLERLNSAVEIAPKAEEISSENVNELLQGVNVAIDCLDNMETRYILNEGCVSKNTPLIHGGVYGLMGEVTTIIPGQTPCFECMFPRGNKREEGLFPVFGATPALIASLQVMEAIKLIAGFGEVLAGKLLYVNGENMEFYILNKEIDSRCQTCSGNKG